MTPEQFAYWLQGFFEISGDYSLDDKKVNIIKDHLKLVFNKVTPDRTEFPGGGFGVPNSGQPFPPHTTYKPYKPDINKVYCATGKNILNDDLIC